jgi:hypothetical protein
MNTIALNYLTKNNHDPHASYNDYIKDCLMSAKNLELSMKDFLPIKPIKKLAYNRKRKISPTNYKLKTAEEIVSHIKRLHMYAIETFELRKAKNYTQKELLYEWHQVQSYKALICSITGEEYKCEQMPI